MTAYDVVVVGAGSAGCAAVNRLCRSSGPSVCLVEAGPDFGPLESGQWPPELLDIHRMPSTHDWGYSAQGADGSTVPEPRARVLGGCSVHNQCGAYWGLPTDYDTWAQAGNPGWSYAELAPLIQQIERAPSQPPLPYRGHQGLIEMRPYRDDELASWHRLFRDTVLRSSFAWLTDLGAPDEPAQGIAPYYANIKGEVRWNAAFAFLDPVRTHPGLTIRPNTLAERLLLEQGRAVGLLCQAQGQVLELRASAFLLCAGAYGSPLLLLRSGIGPGQHLQDMGIQELIALPGVGQNLHDHPGITLHFAPSARGVQLLQEDLAQDRFYQAQAVLRARSTGCAAGFDLHLFSYYNPPEAGAVDFCLFVGYLAPRSRGQVSLGGKAVELPPRIDFQFVTDPDQHDAVALLEGLSLARRLARAEPLASAIERELEPGAEVTSVSDLCGQARHYVEGYAHAVGTCKMGPLTDPTAVVDQGGQVYGTSNVFVADASIIPQIPRAGTNFTCSLIGWRIAERLSARLRQESRGPL
jgi:choline dehydrogenase